MICSSQIPIGKLCRRAHFAAALLLTLALAPTQAIAQATGRTTDRKDSDPAKKAAKPVSLTVALRARARIPGRYVLIRDVAQLSSRDDVLRALEARGVSAKDITWKGSAECNVLAQTVRVTPDDMVRAAENLLRKSLEEEGEQDAEWTVETKLRPLLVPRGRRSRRMHASLGVAQVTRNSARIRVDILVDDEAWTAVSVAFRLRRYRNALVAKRPFRSGDVVRSTNFALQRIDVATRRGDVLDDFKMLEGKVAARNIRTGETLVASDLKMPAIVRKKDTVTVVAAVGRIRVARKGVALASGGRGDRIAVLVEPKRPPLNAEIIAPGLVLVGARSSSFRRDPATNTGNRSTTTPTRGPTRSPTRSPATGTRGTSNR